MVMSLKKIPVYEITDQDMSALLMILEVHIDEINNKRKKSEGDKYTLERMIKLHKRMYDVFFNGELAWRLNLMKRKQKIFILF